MRRTPPWSQKNEARTFPADFCTRNFWGGVSRYAATPLIVALSPGHSDIIRFRLWSPIATGNNLDRAEKIPKVAQTTGIVDVFDPRSGISGPTSRRASACLTEIQRTSKISSWIWSIISGVITFLCHPGPGASQAENSPHLNWANQFLTVAYDGACSPNVSVRMAWISFGTLHCRKKINDSSRLHVVEIACVT